MSTELFTDSVRDLNALVAAAEALETPAMPDVPDWDKSPASFEDGEERTLAEAEALGLEWQVLAEKLNEILDGLGLDAFEEELSELRAKVKAARLALIQLDVYEPPVPGAR